MTDHQAKLLAAEQRVNTASEHLKLAESAVMAAKLGLHDAYNNLWALQLREQMRKDGEGA